MLQGDPLGDREEGLHVAARPNDQDDDPQARHDEREDIVAHGARAVRRLVCDPRGCLIEHCRVAAEGEPPRANGLQCVVRVYGAQDGQAHAPVVELTAQEGARRRLPDPLGFGRRGPNSSVDRIRHEHHPSTK